MSGAALGGLDPAGWACNEDGEIKNGEPQRKDHEDEDEDEEEDSDKTLAAPYLIAAPFVHSQSLEAEDVLRMKVVVAGGGACVGIAGEGYDVERHVETCESIAEVRLDDGTTVIGPDISQDGEYHPHPCLLKDYIPETLPYDLALRINKYGNMPQLRFKRSNSTRAVSLLRPAVLSSITVCS